MPQVSCESFLSAARTRYKRGQTRQQALVHMKELLTAAARVGGTTHLVAAVTSVLQHGPRYGLWVNLCRGKGIWLNLSKKDWQRAGLCLNLGRAVYKVRFECAFKLRVTNWWQRNSRYSVPSWYFRASALNIFSFSKISNGSLIMIHTHWHSIYNVP